MSQPSHARSHLWTSFRRIATLFTLMGVTLAPSAGASELRSGQSCAANVELVSYSEAWNKTTFGDFTVAELSGVTFDPPRNVFYAVADRAGPVPAHYFTIEPPFGTPTITAVTVLKDSEGNPFDGTTLDPEGIVLTATNELIVASEGGSRPDQQPEIVRFSLDGSYLGEIAVPSRFLIGPNNISLESLAVSPNGLHLFTANEAPLPADGRTDDLRRRLRILHYQDQGPDGFVSLAEYFYLTEPGRTDLGVADMLALSETELLVLEREFVPSEGNSIRLFRASLAGAADVSGVDSLAETEIAPVEKSLVLDLADCPAGDATTPGVQPNPLLDNFEAMALGPDLPDGRRQLILISDDNGADVQVTRSLVLALTI